MNPPGGTNVAWAGVRFRAILDLTSHGDTVTAIRQLSAGQRARLAAAVQAERNLRACAAPFTGPGDGIPGLTDDDSEVQADAAERLAAFAAPLQGSLDDEVPAVITPLPEVIALLLSSAVAGTIEMRELIVSCGACRNSLLYLLDTEPYVPAPQAGRIIWARLRALPERHRQHSDRAHPDWNPPQIRGATS